jgi:predicted RNA-binding Zn-ribbon protein involved in translation (DUF1610 family)
MFLINLPRKIYWFLTGRCMSCGGELNVYSYKKASCINCGKKE